MENGGAGTIARSIRAVTYGSAAVIGFLAPCPGRLICSLGV